jgi:hypothetical protein
VPQRPRPVFLRHDLRAAGPITSLTHPAKPKIGWVQGRCGRLGGVGSPFSGLSASRNPSLDGFRERTTPQAGAARATGTKVKRFTKRVRL